MKLSEIFLEAVNQSKQIMNGASFLKKFGTIIDGNEKMIAKVYFKKSESMGNVLGAGEYFSVTIDCLEHYEQDDYSDKTQYYILDKNAKIFVGDYLNFKKQKIKADGLYDPKNDLHGLVVYNKDVVS